MPQGPITGAIAKDPNNVVSLLKVDADGNLKVVTDATGVDSSTKLNMTAANVIKATKGVLKRVVIVAPGSTAGAFTFNDSATVGGAAAANTLLSIAFDAANNFAGSVIELDMPCANGIVLSAVPTAGGPIVAVVYE